MKSSEFNPAVNRQGRRKAARTGMLKPSKKTMGYMSTATVLGLTAAGLVGIQAAQAYDSSDFEDSSNSEAGYNRCLSRGDLYVADTNGATTGGDATGNVIDLGIITSGTWDVIRGAIQNTTRQSNPSGSDTIILCAPDDITIIADSGIDLTFAGPGVRVVNGTLQGNGNGGAGIEVDDFIYEEMGPDGALIGEVATNRITFEASGSIDLFTNLNGGNLTLGGFGFVGFDQLVVGGGADVALNASFVAGGEDSQIELRGGDSYTQNGSLSIVGSYFVANRQAAAVYGLDSLEIDSSDFVSNGSSNTVDRLVDDEENIIGQQVQGGALYIQEMYADSQYDVTIRDSSFSSNEANTGGAIFLENADMLISNVDFYDNQAFRGGAIRATDDSHVKIESESKFLRNNSVYTGGAIDIWDSELHMGDLTSTRVRFEQNGSGFEDLYFGRGNSSNETRNGGAIYGVNTEVTIQGTYFLDNFAEAGGAVFLTENSSIVGSDEITFKDNAALSTGGAMQVEESTVVDLGFADFNNNYAISGDTSRGGAVHADESTLTFSDSQFRFNRASIGGAIYSTKLDTSIQVTENDLTLVDTNFVSNSSMSQGGSYEFDSYVYAGGAIHIWEGDLNITGGEFNSNSAADSGGAINARNSDVVIDGTSFDDNFTTLVENRAFDEAVGAPSEDAERLAEDIVEMYDRNYTWADGLSAPDRGGAIATYAGSTLAISNADFTDSESHFGGAIYALNDVSLTNTNMRGNFARHDGGALYSSEDVSISGGEFTDNRSRADGGAVYGNDDVDIQGALFSGNVADSDGGAVYANTDAFVFSSQFINNSALTADGGAISAESDISVYNSLFDGNSADSDGGALYANNNDIEIVIGSTFTNNRAGDAGGAIYANESVGHSYRPEAGIIDSYFAGNTARYDGGAVYANGNVVVSNSTFRDNIAFGDDGGAIYSGEDALVHGSLFVGNQATSEENSRGGAVYADDGAFVTESTFIDNVAAEYGGAVYADFDLEVSDSYFSKNIAGEEGGALYIQSSDYDDFVTRSVFTYNEVRDLEYFSDYGFRFYDLRDDSQSIYANGSLDITNSTFVSSETNERSQIDIDNGYVMFNTFVGESRTFNELVGNGEDSQIFGNIFAGGTERVFQNGVPATRNGKPVFRSFDGGIEGELYTEDVERNSNGDPIDEFGDIIAVGDLDTYYGFTENQEISFANYDDSGDARYLNFFTSSVEKQGSGINLHFKPTDNLARDFVYGNKVGQISYPGSLEDVGDVQGYLQWATEASVNDNGRYSDLWELLTADRTDFPTVPSSIVGPLVGIDQSGSLRTVIWDAGAREFGSVVVTPVTPPPSGGGGAPAVAGPAPVVEVFTPVTSSVRGFAANSARLTPAMKAKIKRVLAANPGATTISCKGFTSAPPTPGDKALSRARGKAVCDYVRKLDPTITVKVLKGAYENTPGQQIRRVRIVLK